MGAGGGASPNPIDNENENIICALVIKRKRLRHWNLRVNGSYMCIASWQGSIGAAEYSAAHQRSRDLAVKQAIWRHLCDRKYHIKK